MTLTLYRLPVDFTTSDDKESIAENLISIAFLDVVCFYLFRAEQTS